MAASSVVLSVLAAILAMQGALASHRSSSHGYHPGYYRYDDQVAEASDRLETTLEKLDTPGESSNSINSGSHEHRTQRFGVTTYGGSGVQGPYPSGAGVPGVYGPVKIDLGGVLIGSLIGLGAILLLPKLVHAFSYSYGGYGRSVEADMSSFTALLTKVDEMLDRNNVDSSSCVQRVTCSYVQSALDSISVGNGTEVDKFISNLSDNSLVTYMLDGTAIREAVKAGRDANADCQSLYPRCRLDRQTVMKMLATALPS